MRAVGIAILELDPMGEARVGHSTECCEYNSLVVLRQG